MENIIKQGSFVAISDFHSNRWPLDQKIPKYLKQYDVIYILGDATDRGKDSFGNQLEGEGGIQLLLDIMDLCKKYPNRVIYVPGNHDEFLYYYAAHKNTELGSFMDRNLLINGGYYTKTDIDYLRQNNPARLQELINWLGNLPVQRVHIYDNQRYCLAHAFFNQNIFQNNPDYSLEDMFLDNSKFGYSAYSRQEQILWFRKDNLYANYDSLDVPSDAVMVIGHTPEYIREGENLDLQNSKGGITEVKCVDGGITYSANNDRMLKYIGGDIGAIHTLKVLEPYGNSQTYNEDNLTNNEIEIFIEAMIGTAEKLGIDQIRGLIINWIYKDKNDWSLLVTRDSNHRFNVEKLGLEKVKKIIEYYSSSNEKKPNILAENFIIELSKRMKQAKEPLQEDKQMLLENDKKPILQPVTEEIDLSDGTIETSDDDIVSKEIDFPEEIKLSSDDIRRFEEEKAKIMKARFSNEHKIALLKELEQEYSRIASSGKTSSSMKK